MVTLCLFGSGTVFTALGAFLKKRKSLWTLLAAVCVVSGELAGLASGQTLTELLTPTLVVCAASMAALLWGRGGSEG